MSKHPDKKTVGKPASPPAKFEGFRWDIRPEPAATPRDRRWFVGSLSVLVIWLAILIWLAYR
jgi:hypothetical protein